MREYVSRRETWNNNKDNHFCERDRSVSGSAEGGHLQRRNSGGDRLVRIYFWMSLRDRKQLKYDGSAIKTIIFVVGAKSIESERISTLYRDRGFCTNINY